MSNNSKQTLSVDPFRIVMTKVPEPSPPPGPPVFIEPDVVEAWVTCEGCSRQLDTANPSKDYAGEFIHWLEAVYVDQATGRVVARYLCPDCDNQDVEFD